MAVTLGLGLGLGLGLRLRSMLGLQCQTQATYEGGAYPGTHEYRYTTFKAH